MKKLIWVIMAMMLLAVSCSNEDGPAPEPPTPPVEEEDTIGEYPETPLEAPTQYTGYENLIRDTVGDGYTGMRFLEWPGIAIYDTAGRNLLSEEDGNVRDNDFQFIHEGKIYRKGTCMPGFSSGTQHAIGYTMFTPGGKFNVKTLIMGMLNWWFDLEKGGNSFRDYEFVWPEKNYNCYLRVYEQADRIKLPEHWRGHEGLDSATVYSWCLFVNGYAAPVPTDYIRLVVNNDGSVTATYPKKPNR